MGLKYVNSKVWKGFEKFMPPWHKKKKEKDFEEAKQTIVFYEGLREIEYAARRATLKDLERLVNRLSRRKDLKVGAGYVLLGYFANIAKEIATLEKAISREQKIEEKATEETGRVKVSVQISAWDFQGKPIDGYDAEVSFKGAGLKGETRSKKIKKGTVGFKDIMIHPNGNIHLLAVSNTNRNDRPTGNEDYTVKKNDKLIRFTAKQNHDPRKVFAKSLEEALKTEKISGSVGINYKVLKVGAEKASSKSIKEVFSEAVEWIIQVPKDSFDFKQT